MFPRIVSRLFAGFSVLLFASGAFALLTVGQVLARPGASPPLASAQPINVQLVPGGNVAGSVYSSVGGSVVHVVVAGAGTRGGSGSGVVVDGQGLILTNNHVVEGARAVSVRFSTGATREAQVLGTDKGNDLALLKVDLPANVPVATLGDSNEVEVGETAIAIGSPFGLQQTVTQGIVSAVNRTWGGGGRPMRNLIQTDAPINPGNSGGPLFNAHGEVIGINSMIESPVRGSVGVGFAIPINLAKRLLPQLQSGVKVEPAWLGISGQDLDPTLARDLGVSATSGVVVMNVVSDSPAAKAGLKAGQGGNERIPRGGDVITAIDGKSVSTMNQLADLIAEHRPSETVRLSVTRGSQSAEVPVTLQSWPRTTD
jgi:serine protease Do